MMPKKSRRKIVVDGKTYYYVIKPKGDLGEYDRKINNYAKVTIQSPDGNSYYSAKLFNINDVTPSMVEKLIREINVNQSLGL